jgi:hypothetical protein
MKILCILRFEEIDYGEQPMGMSDICNESAEHGGHIPGQCPMCATKKLDTNDIALDPLSHREGKTNFSYPTGLL